MGVSSSSFEFYEGLRILVPGGFLVGLYGAIAATFGVADAVTLGDALIAVLATFAAGLVLLFLDFPSKAAVFYFNAPEPYLRSWTDLAPPPNTSHLTTYYAILDDIEFPPMLRNRIHYLGAIYRIGFETVYIAAAAIPVLLIAVLYPSVGTMRGDSSTTAIRWLFGVALAVHCAVVAWAFRTRYRQHRVKSSQEPHVGRSAMRGVVNDLRHEIPTVDRVLLATGVLGLGGALVAEWRWAGVVGVAIPGLIWVFRYFWGVGASRQNLHPVTAATLFGLSSISLCVLGASFAESQSPLNAAVVVAWLGSTLVAAALITERAHEGRLIGGYSSQRAWLDRNRESLIAKGLLIRRPPEPTPADDVSE